MRLPSPSDRHRELAARARAVFPGCTNNAVSPKPGQELVVERGEGPYLIDVDGRRFLDFALGSGPLILGHAHPRMVATIEKACRAGSHHFVLHHRTIELAERLCRYVPSAERVRFTGSGNESTFNALRLARAVTGRQKIVKFDGAFHGHHDLVAWSFERTATTHPKPTRQTAGFQQQVEKDVAVVPFNDLGVVRALLEADPDGFAAILCEPFQRMLSPEPGFLEGLRDLCDRHGTVLIFDEVVTGFRLAAGGAQEKYGVLPDLTVLGKALTGGMPLSALVGRSHLMDHMDPASDKEHFAFHCGTFNGYFLGAEAAHTCLDILVEEGGLKHLEEIGRYARETLSGVLERAGHTVQMAGEGPLFHAYFSDRPVRNNADVAACDWRLSDRLHDLLFEAGIYKPSVKGYLGMVHTRDHVDQLADVLDWALKNI